MVLYSVLLYFFRKMFSMLFIVNISMISSKSSKYITSESYSPVGSDNEKNQFH